MWQQATKAEQRQVMRHQSQILEKLIDDYIDEFPTRCYFKPAKVNGHPTGYLGARTFKIKAVKKRRKKMKNLLIGSLVVLLITFGFLTPSSAIEWHTANQITVGWDAVTDVVAPDVLMYAVYTRLLPAGEPVLLGEQDTLTAVITFEAEGKYIIGVSTVRYVDVGTETEERLESEVNWSDVNGEFTPVPFGGRYYVPRDPPRNLRRE